MEVKATTDTPISTTEEYAPGGTRKEQILAEARERVRMGYSFWQNNYNESDLDREFLAGNQWPVEIRREREEDNRPMLTINRLVQFVNRVTNDMKQNRTQIKVHPAEATKQGKEMKIRNLAGTQDYDMSEVYTALISDIEYNSNAQAHYDRAADQMVEGGIGWLRMYVAYASDDVFDLALKISSIRNPTSGMIDPMSSEPDWSDARWGTIFDRMPNKEFEKRYPDARKGDLAEGDDDELRYWADDDSVTVTEYITLEPETYRLYQMSNGEVWSSRDIPEEVIFKADGQDDMEYDYIENDADLTVTRQRDVKGHKVVWRKITAWDILEGGEDGIELPFTTVPLVPMFGREIILKDRRNFESLIRHAIDSQRQFNYWQTAATEMVALQPKQPYIGTPVNFEDNEADWEQCNVKNFAFLTYQPDPANGGAPPMRQQLAQNPAAEIQQAMMADESMKATMGIYDASLGNVAGGEESGRAILARERQSDIGTYHFTDNRDKAIARIGKMCVEAIPQIYTDDRIVRLKFPDETEDFVEINKVYDIEGKELKVSDLGFGKYDVRISSGPSYNTLRVEAVNTLIEFIQAVPQAGNAAMDIIASNMDFPASDELAKRLRKMLPPGMVEAEEGEEQVEVPPDPNLQLQLATEQAKNEGKQLDLAKIEAQNQGKAIEAQASGFNKEELQDMILQALAELEAARSMQGGGMPAQQ